MIGKEKVLGIWEEYPSHLWLKLKTYHNETYQFINQNFEGDKFSERAYQYVYGRESRICNLDGCEKTSSFGRFSSGFQKYCSYECSGAAKENKVKNSCNICGKSFITVASRSRNFCSDSCRKKHMKTEEYKQKIVDSAESYNQENYGVDYYFQTEEFKNKAKKTKLEKYDDPNYVNVEKAKNTKKEKYGDPNYNNLKQVKKTKKKRYGDENYNNREKFKKTIKSKFGVDHHLQLESIQEKRKNTCLERYGVEYPTQSSEIMKKVEKTNKEKYGVKYPYNTNTAKNNLKKYLEKNGFGTKKFRTKMEKIYGVKNISKTEYFKRSIQRSHFEKMYNKLFTNAVFSDRVEPLFEFEDYTGTKGYKKYPFRCKKCDEKFYDWLNNNQIPSCPTCFPVKTGQSKAETELYNFIDSFLECEIIRNDQSVLGGRKELDIYIPKKNVAIEFNGIYWHSEKSGGKHKNYHLEKTLLCEDRGVKLIHIFENEWVLKQDIVKNRLRHILGNSKLDTLYARNCRVEKINNKIKQDFLETYHLKGAGKSSVKLGLFCGDDLVGVMTFGYTSISQGYRENRGWEIKRFALSRPVVGAAGKLFKHFIRNYDIEKVITYADRRWSSKADNVYEKIGFEFVGSSRPNYYYFKDSIQISHRFNFRKSVLSEKLDYFDGDLTEWENMQLNGYDRIWDCGHLKYEWTK